MFADTEGMLYRVSHGPLNVGVVGDVAAPRPVQTAPVATTQAPIASAAKVVKSPFDARFWSFISSCSKTGAAQANSVVSLRDNQLSLSERIRLIDEAKHSITFSYYAIGADTVGHAFVDALIRAAQRGVKIIGGLNWTVQEAATRFALGNPDDAKKISQKLDALVRAGGHITYSGVPHEFLDRAGYGNHFKFLCKDSEEVILDGRNLLQMHFEPSMRDIGFQMTGPVAANIERDALAMFQRAVDQRIPTDIKDRFAQERATAITRSQIAAQNEMRYQGHAKPASPSDSFIPITWDPLYEAGSVHPLANPIVVAMVETINKATESIYLTTNYLSDEGDITQALMDAAKRGVDVNVVTRGLGDGKWPWPYIFTSKTYPALAQSGVKIWETLDVKEHGKSLVADGKVGAWGSFNVEIPAVTALVEGMVFTGNPKVVQSILGDIKETLAGSRLLGAQDLKQIAKQRWNAKDVLLSFVLRRWI